MPALARTPEVIRIRTSPPHPAAYELGAKADAARARMQSAGYRRRPPPEWVLTACAWLAGIAVFVAGWTLVAKLGGRIPDPLTVGAAAAKIYGDPFYAKGPNDQGIGWNVLSSLKRVGLGFGLAALVGIPLGFMIGRWRFLAGMAAPVIANTAVGVRQVPQDYLNVARVLQLSEWKVFTKILFPAVLPYMITGVRLSIGVAWLVIVAAEMLTGGVGIGFWVWDEWNNLKVEHIIIAILTIGLVGLALEQGLVLLARRFSYES